jgi:DNA-binding transcriptional LysR family regulator
MEFSSLKAFIAVAENGSFTEASEQLFLTQPAVSKRIAALEEELGAALFDRIGRATTLTEAGQTLLPRARRILEEVDESRRAITNLSGEIGGELSFGTSHHIGLHRLPPILRAFNQAHAQVELDIHFYDSEEACREVGHGTLALALITLPRKLESPLQQLVVWEDPLAVIVANDHPLAGGHASLGELVEYPAIFPAKNTYTRQLIDEALEQHGVSAQVRLATNYLETIKMMVSVGLGWSILPRSMVDEDVTEVMIDGLTLSRQLGVVTHKQRSLTNAAQAFIALLQEGTK